MDVHADVCIIGAGIAGIAVANSIARTSKRRVVVIDSGGVESSDLVTSSLNEVEHARRVHEGATLGRARCLGGTSTSWGGQLLSLLPEDFEDGRNEEFGRWPLGESDLKPYYSRVFGILGLGNFSFDAESLPERLKRKEVLSGINGFAPRYAVWPPFSRRNFWEWIGQDLDRGNLVSFFENTHFIRWELDELEERVQSILCKRNAENQIRIYAHNYVIASGCIEATRQLLLLKLEAKRDIFASTSGLGRLFQDHVSAEAFRLEPINQVAFNKVFGYSFHDGVMRTLRFERARNEGSEQKSSFFHVAFAFPEDSGFEVTKRYLREWQRSGNVVPSLTQIVGLISQAQELMVMGWWRYWHSQLWISPRATAIGVIDIEQETSLANRISLGDSRDIFGVQRARIDWDLSEFDAENFYSTCMSIFSKWTQSDLMNIARLDWRLPEFEQKDMLVAHFFNTAKDVFHPSGSTRMGTNGANSVVDGNLKVHGLANLYVASTSVFPSSGSANPTFTLIALSIRLGDFLSRMR